jgi:radical SAM protein with 4Fe4S-binding SPASM domain
VTNGELVDDEWIRLFKEYGVTVNVSLPGSRTFGFHTSGGSYTKVLAAIRRLSDAGVNVVVSICVTKKNLNELFETIAAGFLNGAKQLQLNRFLPGGRGLKHQDLALSIKEVLAMLETADEACSYARTPGFTGTELPKCILNKKYNMLTASTRCGGGEDFFAVDPSGYVRPCNHSANRLGSYKDLPAAISGEYWQKFKQKDFMPEQCRGCGLSLDCDGGCREAAHLTGGEIYSQDPLFTHAPECPGRKPEG